MNVESEILSGLESSEISFRVVAVERASQEGVSEQVLQALLARKGREADSELQLLMDHAIAEIRRKLSKEPRQEGVAGFSNPKEFQNAFSGANPARRLELLAGLKGAQLQQIGALAPSMLEQESHPLVSAAIIRTFGQSWPEANFKALSGNLGSKSLCLRLAALEVLVQKVPAELGKSLPRLLVSADPRIRGLAVRGLAAIDMAEALLHLQFFLSSQNKNEKISAIENSVFFPFEKIKAMFLRFLSRENDSALLIKAGLLFAMNPDIEVPYRLWEMVGFSTPEKTVVLKAVILDACNALEKSGRLPPKEYQAYMASLDHWVQQKLAIRVVQDSVARLLTEPEGSHEIETQISQNIQNPKMREAFESALSWPLGDKTSLRLRRILYPDSNFAGPEVEEKTRVSESESLREQLRALSLLQNKDRKGARLRIKSVLASAESPSRLIAAALRAAMRLEMADFTDLSSEMMHSSDPLIASAAIEYLNKFAFEKVLPWLRKFLRSDDDRVKVAAIRALKVDDHQAALMSLRTLLFHSYLKDQASALACMIHFDFALIKDMLAEYLASKPPAELFRNGLCLFAANPSPENLYTLYTLEQELGPTERQLVFDVRKNTEAFLIRNHQLTEKEARALEAHFPILWAQEQERNAGPPEPYSLRALQSYFESSEDGFFFSFWKRIMSWVQSFGHS